MTNTVNKTNQSQSTEEVTMTIEEKAAALKAAIKSRNSGEIVAVFKTVHHATVKRLFSATDFNAIEDAFIAERNKVEKANALNRSKKREEIKPPVCPQWVTDRTQVNHEGKRYINREVEKVDVQVDVQTIPFELEPLFDLTYGAVEVYKREIPLVSPPRAISSVANHLRRKHQGFGILAEAIYSVTKKEGDPAKTMRDAWAMMERSAEHVSQAYANTLLAISSNSTITHARKMDLHPIDLPIGEAKTYTAFSDLEVMRKALKDEPDTVTLLARTGRARRTARAVHKVYMELPKWIRKELQSRLLSTKFCTPKQKMKVNGRMVKESAYKALAALEAGALSSRSVQGAMLVARELVKLTIDYSNSQYFWEYEVNTPRKPLHMDEEAYAGEEDKTYSSPLNTYTIQGKTVGERWTRQCEIFYQMGEDFGHAADIAEQALDTISAVLDGEGYEVVYAFIRKVEIVESELGGKKKVMTFEKIMSKEEAAMKIIESREASKLNTIAHQAGVWIEDGELHSKDELLEKAFTPEQRQLLDNLLGKRIAA